jgi:FkbM family methyltransferase
VVRGSHAPAFSDEWRAVNGLREAFRIRPIQIGSDEEGRVLWKTSIGDMWLPPGAGEDYVALLTAEMRANIYALSGRDKIILDCGANVGFFSRYAFLRGAERVIAFEPSPGNAACLRKNLAAEMAEGRFTLIEKGIWDREAVLSFSTQNAGNPGSHHLSNDNQGDIQVPVTAIDSVVDELRVKMIDYIKMDVEGAEVRGLSGAARTIRNMRPRLCIATEHTDDLYANALAVIESMKKTEGSYGYVCTESHGYKSPSQGHVLTPYSVLFESAGKNGSGIEANGKS